MLQKSLMSMFVLCCATLTCAEEYNPPVSTSRLKQIPWADKIVKNKDQSWRPHYDSSLPKEQNSGRIVAYAGKWSRHDFGGHDGLTGRCGWRHAISPVLRDAKVGTSILKNIYDTIDIDGDGDVTDDFIMSIPFDLNIPLNAEDWPLSYTFPERLSARFYGGITWYLANNDKKKPMFAYEWGINCDHAGAIKDGRAEDHPFNGIRHTKIPGSFLKHYISLVWKKEDFLNNGDDYTVSFDDTSRMSTFVMRYWYGINDVRMIAQNGDQFYISEMMPEVPDYAFKYAKGQQKVAFNPLVYPAQLTWAKYNPRDYQVGFEEEGAVFEKRVFDDVQAVGVYFAKTDTSNANTHIKWYGFECDAVITAPKEPSSHIEMKSIPSTDASVPSFNIASVELPYTLWKRELYHYATAPLGIMDKRYVFDKPGDMGSMAYGVRKHESDEPLTHHTFYDTLAVCNTISELEGKEPCYYLDAACTEIFRNQHLYTIYNYEKGNAFTRRNLESPVMKKLPLPKIYVKWKADGHRLPTVAEWKCAYGDGQEVLPSTPQDGTQIVGQSTANTHGIYDMIGNVWELCWTFGDAYDPAVNPQVTALGGDYNYPESPETRPVSPYGDVPFNGLANIGVRLVNRDAGLPAPAMGVVKETSVDMSGIPEWNFKQGEIFGKQKEDVQMTDQHLDMVALPAGSFKRNDNAIIQISEFEISKYTTTYAKWIEVYQWAEAHGYSFSKSGAMGSMMWFDFTHEPEEPVTNITWHDAVTWCNALSEIEGKTPCYYYDEERTIVVRKSFYYRAPKLGGKTYAHPAKQKGGAGLGLKQHYAHPYIFTSWDVDGYRLPTVAELEYVTRGGIDSPFDDELKNIDDYVWGPMNGEGRTHKVGMKKPNSFGVYDIQGNVFEYAFDQVRDTYRPLKRDLDNPIRSPYMAWKRKKGAAAGVSSTRMYVGGPSFLTGHPYIDNEGIGGTQQYSSHYYSDLSFRPVRCEAGTHPKDMHRELAPIVYEKKLKKNSWFGYK